LKVSEIINLIAFTDDLFFIPFKLEFLVFFSNSTSEHVQCKVVNIDEEGIEIIAEKKSHLRLLFIKSFINNQVLLMKKAFYLFEPHIEQNREIKH
jgi:hypothetical protein